MPREKQALKIFVSELELKRCESLRKKPMKSYSALDLDLLGMLADRILFAARISKLQGLDAASVNEILSR